MTATLQERAELVGSTRLALDLARRDGRTFDHRMLADGGTERLRRWCAGGAAAPDYSALVYEGSDAVRRVVLEVLHASPEPVAWWALRTCVFVELGRTFHGFHWQVERWPSPGDDSIRIIGLAGSPNLHGRPVAAPKKHKRNVGRRPVELASTALDDQDVAGTLAHELGHFFASPPTPPRPPMSPQDEHQIREVRAAYRRSAVDDGEASEIVENEARRERAADALGSLLIGRPVTTYQGRYASSMMSGLLAEAAAHRSMDGAK